MRVSVGTASRSANIRWPIGFHRLAVKLPVGTMLLQRYWSVSETIRHMRTSYGRRRIIATILIAVLMLGLALVLIFAGLPTAANVVQILGVVAIAGPLIAWARVGTKMAPAENRTFIVDQQSQSETAQLSSPVANPPKSPARQRLTRHNNGVIFRSPIPWAQWSAFWLLAIALAVAIACICIAIATRSEGFAATGIMLGAILVFAVAFDILFAAFAGEEFHLGNIFKEVFKFRPTLDISDEGIRYYWNSKHDFSCPWQDIALITSDTRSDGSPRLAVVLNGRTSDFGTVPGRGIFLCTLNSPGFPTDEILAAIARRHASLLDPSL